MRSTQKQPARETSNKGTSLLSQLLQIDDGVVLVDHGSRVAESNQALLRIAVMFQQTLQHPNVEPAHMELAEPSIEQAVQRCVENGAKRIVVVPFFLLPGRHWQQDIPQLTAAACKKFNVDHLVTAPLGESQGVVNVLIGRMEHCLHQAKSQAGGCDACQSTHSCWKRQN